LNHAEGFDFTLLVFNHFRIHFHCDNRFVAFEHELHFESGFKMFCAIGLDDFFDN